MSFDSDEFWLKFWCRLGGSVVVFVVSLFGYMIVRATDASGQGDYCYINSWQGTKAIDGKSVNVVGYTLKQHVSWGSDRVIVHAADSVDEAVKAAERIQCPVK